MGLMLCIGTKNAATTTKDGTRELKSGTDANQNQISAKQPESNRGVQGQAPRGGVTESNHEVEALKPVHLTTRLKSVTIALKIRMQLLTPRLQQCTIRLNTVSSLAHFPTTRARTTRARKKNGIAISQVDKLRLSPYLS